MAQTGRVSVARIVTPGEVVLGKFKILGPEPMNVGGMGVLWEALVETGASAGEKRAVKVMLPELASDKEFVRRFKAEADIAKAMSDLAPALFCRVYGCYDDDEYGCILVLERLYGTDLAFEIAQSQRAFLNHQAWTFGRTQALEIVHRVLRALVVMHGHTAAGQAVIHRDVKPENIFLCSGGEVKVLDFGISKLLGSGATSKTKTGYSLGTPLYMPYEQHMGQRDLDGRVDVHALGAVFFEMLTLRLPYAGQNSAQLVVEMRDRGPRPCIEGMPTWDGAEALRVEVAAFVDRAIKVDRNERFQTAREMQSALEDIMGRYGVPYSADEDATSGAPATTKQERPEVFTHAPTVAVPTPTPVVSVPDTTLELGTADITESVAEARNTPPRSARRGGSKGSGLVIFGILLAGISAGGMYVSQHGFPKILKEILSESATRTAPRPVQTIVKGSSAPSAVVVEVVREVNPALCRAAPYVGRSSIALYADALTSGGGTFEEQQAFCCCLRAGDFRGNDCRTGLAKAGNLRRCLRPSKGKQ